MMASIPVTKIYEALDILKSRDEITYKNGRFHDLEHPDDVTVKTAEIDVYPKIDVRNVRQGPRYLSLFWPRGRIETPRISMNDIGHHLFVEVEMSNSEYMEGDNLVINFYNITNEEEGIEVPIRARVIVHG